MRYELAGNHTMGYCAVQVVPLGEVIPIVCTRDYREAQEFVDRQNAKEELAEKIREAESKVVEAAICYRKELHATLSPRRALFDAADALLKLREEQPN